jgi:OOP family OmpA-OmpF porin
MKKVFLIVPAIKIMAMVLFAFVFLLPVSAYSQIKAGSFEVSPFVGYNFFEKTQNLKNSPVYGGRLGYNFTKHWGIEATGEYMRTGVDDRGMTEFKEGRFRSPTDGVDLTFYHLDAVYHFMPDSKFTPFLVMGVGGAHYDPSISTNEMLTFNFGAGVKYWVTEHIAIRLDVRDNFVGEVFQETYHNVAATIGLTFAFGGSKPAPTQVVRSEPEPEARVAPKAEQVIIVAEEPAPKVEEKVAVAAAEPQVEEKIIVIAFEDVHFEFDKSTLTKEAKTILKRSIVILKDNPESRIRIAGYTSASGTAEYNQRLSERRARSVEDYLVKEGLIAPDRLTTIGYGKTRPAEYEASPKDLYSKAAKANMRVLFEVIVK